MRHDSADDVAVFLREAQARGLMVLAPLPDSGFAGVVSTDGAPLDAHAAGLAERFGSALLLAADDAGWSLRVLGPAATEVRSNDVPREAARKAAQAVSQALGLPKITTALERALKRPLSGVAALEKVGEALDLVACARTPEEVEADEGLQKLRVEGTRIVGRIAGPGAGAGYAHVSELIEDTVVDLLRKGRIEAALRQLRGYDIHLSLEDGALRCRAPQGLMTDGLKQALAAHKDAVVATLSAG